jgi:hypothetical protein
MGFQPPIELTWRNLFKASFLAIGDAALIAMIKDAELSLQLALVVASIIGFVALVKEDWLRAKHPVAFQFVLGVSAAIFLGFIIFATSHAYRERLIDKKLDELRSQGLEIYERPKQSTVDTLEWQKQVDQWRDSTAKYLEENIGIDAKKRFLITVGRPSYSYGAPAIDHQMNVADWSVKNLQDIIESRNKSR